MAGTPAEVTSAGCILSFTKLSSPRVETEQTGHLCITARLDWCCKPGLSSLSQHWWDAQLWVRDADAVRGMSAAASLLDGVLYLGQTQQWEVMSAGAGHGTWGYFWVTLTPGDGCRWQI